MGKIDLTGQPFGRLVVIREAGRANGAVTWLCRCLGRKGDDCGNEVVVDGRNLRRGQTKSCGCLRRDRTSEANTKHGLTIDHKRLLASIKRHISMIRNPYAHKHEYYKHFRIPAKYLGTRGAARFAQEVVKRYPKEAEGYEHNKNLELDKDISGELVFAPCNIRFVTCEENRSHRRNTLKLDDGTPLAQFCSSIGIETKEGKADTPVYHRIRAMWRTRHKPHPELMQALREDTDRQSRLLEIAKLKIRRAELMIASYKELLASKQTA